MAFCLLPDALAQAPSTLTGDGILIQITSGTYPLASHGYSVFLPANSGNSYQLIGIYGVANNIGTYSYATTGPNNGQIIISDVTDSATEQVGLAFSTPTQGSFSVATISPPGYYQNGYFVAAVGSALSSVAGKSVYCTVSDGLYPFAYTGNATLVFSPSVNTYTVTGSSGVANSSGTYSYSLVNRSTASMVINDSVSGSSTVYLGFSTARTGGYAIKQASTGGFQIGSFTVLDTTPPTVSITSPTAGQLWSNAVFTVSGTAADDMQVAAVYYQVAGQGWNLATTANNWANWSGSVTLRPGTNIIQAYSVDTSANSSPVSSQNMYYALVAPITVQTNGYGTISPNYNGQLLEIGKSYSMTATAGAGFAFANWTILTNGIGGIVTNGATLNFVMQSNLTAQANFLDVTKPTLAITAPTSGQRWSNELFTAMGTATDNWQLEQVWYALNGQAWTNAVTTNGWTNWSANITLLPGTNTLAAYAVDSSGNISTTNSVSFQYVVTNLLQLSTVGLGTLSPNYSNAWLEIGRAYSITATPSSGFAFTNWTMSTNGQGSVKSSAATLPFTMTSNLALQATFAEVTRPTLIIIAPTANQKMTNALVNMVGIASDNLEGDGRLVSTQQWQLGCGRHDQQFHELVQTVDVGCGHQHGEGLRAGSGREFFIDQQRELHFEQHVPIATGFDESAGPFEWPDDKPASIFGVDWPGAVFHESEQLGLSGRI